MKLWSIQPVYIYEKITDEGTYRCDGAYVDNDFRDAYEWLVEQMKNKIGQPPAGVEYPVWAWHTRDGKHKKPDLRHAGYGATGEELVCMELEIPDEKVVLTDFDAWHFVLNGWYLNAYCDTEETWDKDHEKLAAMSVEDRIKSIEESWQAVFDIEPFDNGWTAKGFYIQATFWEIKKENVVSVRYFKAR